MRSNKVIHFYIDNMERYDFFSRLFFSLNSMDYDLKVVSNRLSVCLAAKNSDVNFCFLKRTSKRSDLREIEKEKVLRSTSVVSGRLLPEDAIDLARSMRRYIRECVKENDIFCIWNGSCAVGAILKLLKVDFQYKTLFFEIANLPNRLFVDSEGVNAQSSLFSKPETIKSFPAPPSFDYYSWYGNYLEFKKNPPPQLKFQKRISSSSLVDYIGYLFGSARDASYGPFYYLLRKLKFRKKAQITLSADSEFDKYVFVPLQVSNDSQIIVNSDYDNIDLISRACSDKSSSGYTIVVKVHPAEPDYNFYEKIYNRFENEIRKGNIVFSNRNTNELIAGADFVYVINSTVGLEALLVNKPVTVIGRSFYSWFDFDDIKSYISSYLIECEYFSQERIDKDITMKIIERAC